MKWKNVSSLGALGVALAACSDRVQEPLSPALEVSASAAAAQQANVITDDPRAFAQAVRAARNENELIVWLKDASLSSPGAGTRWAWPSRSRTPAARCAPRWRRMACGPTPRARCSR